MDLRFFEKVPGRCGGRVTFRGRRLEPWHVVGRLRAGESEADICEDMDLTKSQLDAAVEYMRGKECVDPGGEP